MLMPQQEERMNLNWFRPSINLLPAELTPAEKQRVLSRALARSQGEWSSWLSSSLLFLWIFVTVVFILPYLHVGEGLDTLICVIEACIGGFLVGQVRRLRLRRFMRAELLSERTRSDTTIDHK